MSDLKVELMDVLRHELKHKWTLDREVNGETILVVPFVEGIIKNDNLLQELENVVHSFNKHNLELSRQIPDLQGKLNYLQEELDRANKYRDGVIEQRNNLKSRNERLHEEVKKLQRGISRGVKRAEKCNHTNFEYDNTGLAIESAVKLLKNDNGTFVVKCTKCGEQF